jgi:hypothetical protein
MKYIIVNTFSKEVLSDNDNKTIYFDYYKEADYFIIANVDKHFQDRLIIVTINK